MSRQLCLYYSHTDHSCKEEWLGFVVDTKVCIEDSLYNLYQYHNITNKTSTRTDQYDHRQQTHICFKSHRWMVCAAVSMYQTYLFKLEWNLQQCLKG